MGGGGGGGGHNGPVPPPPPPRVPPLRIHVLVRLCVREHMQTQRRDIATAEMAYTYPTTPTYIMICGSGPSMNMIAFIA